MKGSSFPRTICQVAANEKVDGQLLPTVTVVTPSFNQAPFLEQTIRSVLEQGYPKLEYMVLDGGSTDGSVEMIRKYAPRLSYWRSEHDAGQCDAINSGWTRASGDIVAYLNSDDVYLANAIHTAAAFMQTHPEAELVYGFIQHIDESGNVFDAVQPPHFTVSRLLEYCFIPQPTVFMRRSLLQRIGPLDESLHYSFDYEYWLRASRVTTPMRIPAFIAAARYHGASKTGSQLQSFVREEITIFDRMFAPGSALSNRLDLSRRAYLPRLTYMSGYESGFLDDERAEALRRLHALAQPVTTREITAILAGLDRYLASPYAGAPLAGQIPSHVCDNADICEILPSLVDGQVLSRQAATSVQAILRARNNLRALQASPALTRWKALPVAALQVSRDPEVIADRGWWADVLASIPFGSVLVQKYYAWRDLPRVVIHRFMRSRRIADGRDS